MVDISLLQSLSYVAAAIGVCIAAFYYVLTLRVQQTNMKHTLETRQAQIVMSISDRFTGGIFDNYIQLNNWKIDSIDEFMEMFSEKDWTKGRTFNSMYWIYEELGTLVHEGLIDIRLVARMIGYFKRDWEKWGPLIKQYRVIRNDPRWWVEAEYLYNRLAEFGRQNPEYNI